MILVNALSPNEVDSVEAANKIAGKAGKREVLKGGNDSLTTRPSSSPLIYILTAPIQSGKTTSLVNWSDTRNNVYGILTPVADGKRVFMNAHSRQIFLMESKKDETEVLSVGRFSFSKANFAKAAQIIHEARHHKGWLIIDEIGPMELSGRGFSEVLIKVLAIRQDKTLLVVREGLVDKVKEYFNIQEAGLITDVTVLKKLPD